MAYYGYSVKRRGLRAIDPGATFSPLNTDRRLRESSKQTVQYAIDQARTEAMYGDGGGGTDDGGGWGGNGGAGPNDSVTGILSDPIVQKGLGALVGFGVGAWLGSMLSR